MTDYATTPGADAKQILAIGLDARRQCSRHVLENLTDASGHMPSPPAIAPPFTADSAARKVRLAENAWNSRDPERVSLAYSEDSRWRNRSELFAGRPAIVEFLRRKWQQEVDYRLIKELWAFGSDRIAVRFQYEWQNGAGQWHRSYGNELWRFDAAGLMQERHASINDVPIAEGQRRFRWPAPGPRPEDHPGLSELGL